MVMDSPFGSLDPVYGTNIAKLIPTLTPQVILMVSKTQWNEDIKKAFNSKIGKEYVLSRLETKPIKEETINLYGTEYKLISKSEKESYTKILEVK